MRETAPEVKENGYRFALILARQGWLPAALTWTSNRSLRNAVSEDEDSLCCKLTKVGVGFKKLGELDSGMESSQKSFYLSVWTPCGVLAAHRSTRNSLTRTNARTCWS